MSSQSIRRLECCKSLIGQKKRLSERLSTTKIYLRVCWVCVMHFGGLPASRPCRARLSFRGRIPGASVCENTWMVKPILIGLLSFAGAVASNGQAPAPVKATPLLTKDLQGVPGKEGLLLTVDLAPGAGSAPHKHEASTFVYVLEGSVVMGVKGGKEVTLGPGQTFYESPGDVHTVSRNASATKPAKFLVFMVKEKGAPVSIPVRDSH